MSRPRRWFLPLAAAATVVAVACHVEHPSPDGSPASDDANEATSLATTDTSLAQYLAWTSAWMALTNRHVVALDAASQRLATTDPAAISRDPALLALVTQQRAEMQTLMARVPQGLTARALRATILGIGHVDVRPDGMFFVPRRDEAALAAARASYGAAFVDWVLAHESTIVTTLTSAKASS